MNSQIKEISGRIKKYRELAGISAESIAEKLEMSESSYSAYEDGSADITIGVIYLVAAILNIDPTVLLTGMEPAANDYAVVVGGKGVIVERYKGYKFTSLASDFIGRDMEPMIVEIEPHNHLPELISHAGQEFNYVLEGTVTVIYGDREIILSKGDSIYFNARTLHGQKAVGGPAKFLVVING
ncbi:MAG: XRE family transcriptional regulator [Clostridiales bacterium]|nr:XRE family transcriptional regulator [Clostridiales bacterium]